MKKYVFYKVVLVTILLLQLMGGEIAKADKNGTIAYLHRIKDDTQKLYDFFRKMPKGGDIHTHLTGAVTPETYWQLATQSDSWYIDTATGQLKTDSGLKCISLKDNEDVKKKVFSKWSVRGWTGKNQRDSAEHFFNAFGLTGDLADIHTVELLKALKDSVYRDNIQYLELMAVSPKINKKDDYYTNGRYQEDATSLASTTNFKPALLDLMKKDDYQSFVKAIAQSYVENIRKYDTESTEEAWKDLVCRYQGYTNRNTEDLLKVFTQLYASFEACAMEKRQGKDPLVVGVNIVSEESAKTALDNYDKHMLMFEALKERYKDTVKISLHAGELVTSVLTQIPESGSIAPYNHIKKALKNAGADRIGHGIDINQKYKERDFEEGADDICKMMLKKGSIIGESSIRNDTVAVEVNLTSNDFILGVKGNQHCLVKYKEQKVPFVIATDDQGILCTNLTEQYVKLVREHGLDYEEIKKIVYNSIRYSFTSSGVKEKLRQELDRKFAAFEGIWTK